MNKYIALYKGKKIEVQAETSFTAQEVAAKQFKAKKRYEVDVYICEMSDGSAVVYNGTEF
jgi:hypothetical protein